MIRQIGRFRSIRFPSTGFWMPESAAAFAGFPILFPIPDLDGRARTLHGHRDQTGNRGRMTLSRVIVASCLLVCIASVANAQQANAATTRSADERAVLDLEEAWAKGVVKRDA